MGWESGGALSTLISRHSLALPDTSPPSSVAPSHDASPNPAFQSDSLTDFLTCNPATGTPTSRRSGARRASQLHNQSRAHTGSDKRLRRLNQKLVGLRSSPGLATNQLTPSKVSIANGSPSPAGSTARVSSGLPPQPQPLRRSGSTPASVVLRGSSSKESQKRSSTLKHRRNSSFHEQRCTNTTVAPNKKAYSIPSLTLLKTKLRARRAARRRASVQGGSNTSSHCTSPNISASGTPASSLAGSPPKHASQNASPLSARENGHTHASGYSREQSPLQYSNTYGDAPALKPEPELEPEPEPEPAVVQEIDRAPCRICNRKFHVDRVRKHEKVCARVGAKKRRVFKPLRVPKAAVAVRRRAQKATGRREGRKLPRGMAWKSKSHQLRAAMAAARRTSTAIKAGKPLPPVDVTAPPTFDDRVLCNNCGRKFSQQAADRHIPLCKSIIAKPKVLKRGTGIMSSSTRRASPTVMAPMVPSRKRRPSVSRIPQHSRSRRRLLEAPTFSASAPMKPGPPAGRGRQRRQGRRSAKAPF